MPTELELAAQWQIEAREQTLETLPTFLKKLSEHPHDYGTIVRAIGAAAVAAAWAIERSPQGGITGFQASAVKWEFLEHWEGIKPPAWLHRGEDLLYPQYAEQFTTIGNETWKWLQKQAAKNLTESKVAAPAVVSHWEAIVSGKVPFGLQIKP